MSWYSVERGSEPIHCQVRNRIREFVATGALPPGTRIPSSRALAKALGVSRNTVLEAYEMLKAEGVLKSSGKSGTFVSRQGLTEAHLALPPVVRTVGSPLSWHDSETVWRARNRRSRSRHDPKSLSSLVRLARDQAPWADCGYLPQPLPFHRWFEEERGLRLREEDVRCDGCLGDRSRHWSPDCWILRCSVDDKGLRSCAECRQFPCARLEEWADGDEGYRKALERLKGTA